MANSRPPARSVSRSSSKPYDPLWFEEPVPPEMPEQMASLRARRAFRSRPASADDQVRIRARARERRRQHPADESRPRRRLLEAKKIAALAEVHYAQIAPHLYCGPIVGRRQHSNRDLLAEFPDSRKHHAVGRLPRRTAQEADRWDRGYVIPPTTPGSAWN
jgi:galactonate dehydratase